MIYSNNHFFVSYLQTYVYTNPLGEFAAKSGVVINCVHFSPTDHIIAFSGMVTGHHHSSSSSEINGVPSFTAPVYVYKNKVNASNGQLRRRSQTLPSLPLKLTKDVQGSADKSTGEKFKSMLSQLDRIILDKQEEIPPDQ